MSIDLTSGLNRPSDTIRTTLDMPLNVALRTDPAERTPHPDKLYRMWRDGLDMLNPSGWLFDSSKASPSGMRPLSEATKAHISAGLQWWANNHEPMSVVTTSGPLISEIGPDGTVRHHTTGYVHEPV